MLPLPAILPADTDMFISRAIHLHIKTAQIVSAGTAHRIVLYDAFQIGFSGQYIHVVTI